MQQFFAALYRGMFEQALTNTLFYADYRCLAYKCILN